MIFNAPIVVSDSARPDEWLSLAGQERDAGKARRGKARSLSAALAGIAQTHIVQLMTHAMAVDVHHVAFDRAAFAG